MESNLKPIENAIKNLTFKTSYRRMSPESVAWFRKFVTKNFSRFTQTQALQLGTQTLKPKPGMLYCWGYDPKHKLTLPYYDTFPMGLCINIHKDGFTMINFHYLSPKVRQALFIDLLGTMNQTGLTDRMKFKITWQKMMAWSQSKYVKHACKRYLTNHLMTPLCRIDPEYWEVAIFLPLARFEKASAQSVWGDV